MSLQDKAGVEPQKECPILGVDTSQHTLVLRHTPKEEEQTNRCALANTQLILRHTPKEEEQTSRDALANTPLVPQGAKRRSNEQADALLLTRR